MTKKKPTIRMFLTTLFIKQNQWHKHSVLGHTLKVTYHTIINKDYKFIIPALLHDIGKPFVAFQDEKDKVRGTYSFTDHEEKSYQIIKNWPFLSDWTKDMVRYHYLIRDLQVCIYKGRVERYKSKKEIWDTLPKNIRKDLAKFIKYDDKGKK